jgi:protein tyrosine/serine phosphatase
MATPPPSDPPKATTQLPPPFINIPTLPNLRDAGGYPTATSGAVRKRVLYRSADPSRASLGDLQTINTELGISAIFDLRSLPEIERAGTLPSYEENLAQYPTVKRKWTPVFKAQDYSPEAVAVRFKDYGADEDGEAGFVRAYAQILEHAGPALQQILRHLGAPTEEEGVLIHCTAGKDRAGCVMAVILSLLGVPPDIVASEYSLTEQGLGDLKPYFVDRLMASGAFDEFGERGRRAAERMVGARKEAMAQTLRLLDEKYGGVEGYVRDVVGLDADVVERIRSRYVLVEGDRAGANGYLAKQHSAL